MSLALRQVVAIVRKDLRVELRTREVVYTALLFAIVLVTLFVFSGFGETSEVRRAAPGVLWVSVAFLGTLVFGRTFQREREHRAVVGMLMAPNALGPLYVSKLVVNVVMLGVVELVLVPAVAFAFRVDLAQVAAGLAAIMALGTLGYAALGTVLSAALSTLRMREVILPLVLFPLSLPLLLSSVQATRLLVESGTLGPTAGWLAVMAAFDVLFLFLSRWLFEQALDTPG